MNNSTRPPSPQIVFTAATVFPRREIEQFSACAWLVDDVIEVRLINRHGEVKMSWHLAAELPALIYYLAEHNRQGWNIYVGANPRAKHGDTGDANIRIARCLFVDFDKITLDVALHRIAAAGLPLPTMVIWSGHGCHCYFRLTVPLTDLAEWRRLQKGLIAILDSDKSIHNPERIMRLASWLNNKGEPVLSYIVHAAPDDRYDVGIFTKIIAEHEAKNPPPAPPPLPPPSKSSSPLRMFDANPKRWLDLAIERARSEGRNNGGLWLATQLRDDGLSEQEAAGWMRSYTAAVPDAGHAYQEHEATASLRQAFKRPARGKAQKLNTTARWLPDPMRHSSRVSNRGVA